MHRRRHGQIGSTSISGSKGQDIREGGAGGGTKEQKKKRGGRTRGDHGNHWRRISTTTQGKRRKYMKGKGFMELGGLFKSKEGAFFPAKEEMKGSTVSLCPYRFDSVGESGEGGRFWTSIN